jgi:MoxR-like ATPase
MPSDVVGTTVFNPQTAQFTTRTGPIFANVVLADEVNRTPPKTQAALLEAMEEGRVTIDGVMYLLPQPFLLCATQNPIEYEGTYPLPEAQLDRFTIKLESAYPTETQELELLARTAAGFDARALEASNVLPVTNAGEVLEAQNAVRKVHLSDGVREYTYRIVATTRSNPRLTLGASPRAGVHLLVAAQTAAAIAGRDFATPDDVKDVAGFVIPHRLIVAPDAEIEGISASAVLQEVLATVPVPR